MADESKRESFESYELERIKASIRAMPNHPKKGIIFRDITTLLMDGEMFSKTINLFYGRYRLKEIDLVAGVEARGFIFGGALANRLGVGFIPIRKKGKLPYKTISQKYDLEYGTNEIEIHIDAIKPGEKVLVMDDLLATGGTLYAASSLVERLGGKVVECACVIELPGLKGREKLSKWPVYSIVKFEGE